MPEVTVKYKNAHSLKALKDLSKYLDFEVVKSSVPKSKNKILKEIESGLKQVKLIQQGKMKRQSLKDVLNGRR